MDKMTRDRTPEVIRAVMQALRNAERLTREAAMEEETRLFCELAKMEWARRKSEGS
jgi:hypothetical protein